MKKILVWFRKDLRIHDNPALWEAAQQGIVIPVFIWSEEEEREYATSEASHWWLHHSLLSLKKKLESKGLLFVIRLGNCLKELTTIIEQTNADAVFYGERYEPSILKRDQAICKRLTENGIEVRSFQSNLLFPPGDLLNQKNDPYKVFTSFWKRTMKETVQRPLPIPDEFAAYDQAHLSVQIDELGLLPAIRWDEKFHAYWEPGEKGAIARWQQFTEEGLSRYVEGRDSPSADSVSLLSPHLAWGDISVRSIWHAAKRLTDEETEEYMHTSVEAFLRQLIWREFAYHQLIHFPTMVHSPLREQFKGFPWLGSDEEFARWQKGLTGYPLVDAGMRELWETGAMHNRVRMVVASFLVKHLLISWTEGSTWFKETLVDYDVANNAMGWQWVAGTGIDAAPYFRIFNPILQSKKFDADGEYIRKWLPELASLSSKYLHEPWKAPADKLLEAGIELGTTYPLPIIDHSLARHRALEAFAKVKNNS
ncbi:deoxyribodipyrimidine photo-lyase [Sporosarcina sp. ANT_H38]|uniref:cryptochrome/photolyase family protein n=1 Tax=Sporosarcina sp. ANT_H38 TaxID=2597358 RepID=UPI0011F23C43|nr:deoxyribodipyrimidine photo-lyase [Sporosarcina sp. ANT_H38]KAA0966034.1 deoxyribodipyrimidine photo-lyase [Sporosarcina sp. ANT_H38]